MFFFGTNDKNVNTDVPEDQILKVLKYQNICEVFENFWNMDS